MLIEEIKIWIVCNIGELFLSERDFIFIFVIDINGINTRQYHLLLLSLQFICIYPGENVGFFSF